MRPWQSVSAVPEGDGAGRRAASQDREAKAIGMAPVGERLVGQAWA
jgi:hypothetical protein